MSRLRRTKEGSTTARGYGWAHQVWRAAILARDPVCTCKGYAGCKHKPGACLYASTDADHIDGDQHNRAMTNGQGLCEACHNNKTRLSNTDKPSPACNESGIPVDPTHHWNT